MPATSGDSVIAVDRLLADLGFDTPAASAKARAILEDAGLTRPGKVGISAAKRPAVEEALSTLLVRHCGDPRCTSWAVGDRSDRDPVGVGPAGCELCGGSNNRRAARLLEGTLARRGIARVLIVGGSPSTAQELREMLPGIEVRVVEGTGRPDERRAAQDRAWSQVVVVWATTILDHKVSQLYTRGPHLTVARRGVEALCDELRAHLGGSM